MFMGEYNHTIDAKGRLIIPSKFREQLGEAFVITNGNDGCLSIYSKEDWDSVLEKLKALPGNRDKREIIRKVVAQANEVELDKQGRILIPQSLRESAGLEKDVVLAGVLGRVEIWDKTRWHDTSDYDDVDDIAEHMSEFGFMI